MLELVPQHVIPPHWSPQQKVMTMEHTDWKAVGMELGRAPKDCNLKYNLIHYRQMKKGHFTAKEDALIYQRVEEWGDKGKGLWVALEKELNRMANSIRQRWGDVLSKYA